MKFVQVIQRCVLKILSQYFINQIDLITKRKTMHWTKVKLKLVYIVLTLLILTSIVLTCLVSRPNSTFSTLTADHKYSIATLTFSPAIRRLNGHTYHVLLYIII